MMTKVWDELFRRVQSWPPDDQEELAQVALEIETALKNGTYRASPSELEGIDRGLRDAAGGKLASEDDVEATIAKVKRGIMPASTH